MLEDWLNFERLAFTLNSVSLNSDVYFIQDIAQCESGLIYLDSVGWYSYKPFYIH